MAVYHRRGRDAPKRIQPTTQARLSHFLFILSIVKKLRELVKESAAVEGPVVTACQNGSLIIRFGTP